MGPSVDTTGCDYKKYQLNLWKKKACNDSAGEMSTVTLLPGERIEKVTARSKETKYDVTDGLCKKLDGTAAVGQVANGEDTDLKCYNKCETLGALCQGYSFKNSECTTFNTMFEQLTRSFKIEKADAKCSTMKLLAITSLDKNVE